MTTTTLTIKGMSCGNCVRHVESALKKQNGVAAVTVDLAAGQATVEFDPQATNLNTLKQAVTDAGYEATANDE
ncbi:MAG: cation transporter [Dehalogenimonas sp.]|uniref:Copper chaperone CopZ n=1 Tax=Candidatus Dehalogenimonas loeffleri TaxID=3127115 RepID=A0ABZ2J676_9CHLR|nr:cation transporter [Dehalogenimonas sp.]